MQKRWIKIILVALCLMGFLMLAFAGIMVKARYDIDKIYTNGIMRVNGEESEVGWEWNGNPKFYLYNNFKEPLHPLHWYDGSKPKLAKHYFCISYEYKTVFKDKAYFSEVCWSLYPFSEINSLENVRCEELR